MVGLVGFYFTSTLQRLFGDFPAFSGEENLTCPSVHYFRHERDLGILRMGVKQQRDQKLLIDACSWVYWFSKVTRGQHGYYMVISKEDIIFAGYISVINR